MHLCLLGGGATCGARAGGGGGGGGGVGQGGRAGGVGSFYQGGRLPGSLVLVLHTIVFADFMVLLMLIVLLSRSSFFIKCIDLVYCTVFFFNGGIYFNLLIKKW